MSQLSTATKSRLADNKLKATKARLATLEILESNPPLTANQIFEFLKQKDRAADRATVYRILDQFCKVELAIKIQIEEGKILYEGTNAGHHHHLVCKICKKIEPIHSEKLELQVKKLEQELASTNNFENINHSLEFFGICKDCQ